MRTEAAVEDYVDSIRYKYGRNPGRLALEARLYSSCIPSDFLSVADKDVIHNRHIWQNVVLPYCDKADQAREQGYGLYFEGDNGVGKTMFLCYLLSQVIHRGYSAYYTTVLDMDLNLKRGLHDFLIMERENHLLLYSDFLGLDELTKERSRFEDSWIRSQIERVLKFRHDYCLPTIIATNANIERIGQVYGGSVRSVLRGKYYRAAFLPGDIRKNIQERMRVDMGYPPVNRKAVSTGETEDNKD